MPDPAPLTSARLRLEALRPETIEALLAGDKAAADQRQGRILPDQFFDPADEDFLKIQLDRMTTRPEGRGWCGRVMVRDSDGAVLGHCGFHGPPADVGRAEVGYTVLPAHRRQGYAVEAVEALLGFARSEGATVVFASVSPDNVASLAVIGKLGFRQTGTQMDEIDGEEGVFEVSL